jgi:glycosyltransferase involved in cell wall biosynthesis
VDQPLTGPLVGVVIPAYNVAEFLGAALRSLLAQSHRHWRCVVVDDGSTDGTAAVAQSFEREDDRIQLHRQANAGAAAARNAGIRCLSPGTDFVCFLDADDVLIEHALESLISALKKRPDAVGSFGWADHIDTDGRPLNPGEHRANSRRLVGRGLRVRVQSAEEDTTFNSLAVQVPIWPPATALLRFGVVLDVGEFDERLPTQEDRDFFVRAGRRGPIVFVDRQMAWYRRREGNLSANWALNDYYLQVVTRKTWSDPENTPRQRRVVLVANLRTLAWELLVQLRLMGSALRRGSLALALQRACGSAYLLTQLVAIRPVVPPRRLAYWMVRLDLRGWG